MCFVCAMAAPPHLKEQPIGEWFIFTAMTAFWVSLILLVSWTSFLKLQLLIPLCWYRCHIGKRHQTSLYKRWLLFFCSGNVLGACNRKVPCHPLADDRVRLLCALVLLLLYSSSCFCSEGGGYIICEHYVKHGVSKILWHGSRYFSILISSVRHYWLWLLCMQVLIRLTIQSRQDLPPWWLVQFLGLHAVWWVKQCIWTLNW